MIVLDTEQLAELIANKRKCLLELREMVSRQEHCIEQGEMSTLIKVLGAKQMLINRLGQLERAMDPFRAEDPEARVWRSPEERTACRKNSQECDAILGEILERERQCESTLQVRREETARQLQGSHESAMTRQAYAEARPRAMSQIDLMK